MSGKISESGFCEGGLRLKKVGGAFTEFQEAKNDPQQAGKAFAQVGLYLKALRREDEAVTAFRQALENGPFSTIERANTNFQDGDREGIFKFWEQLKPKVVSFLSQTWQRLARYVGILETPRPFTPMSSRVREKDHWKPLAKHYSLSAPPDLSVQAQMEFERRRQSRITVQMLSQFSSKTPILCGEGEIRDLSASGCRITSPVRVPLGTEVECWIYPNNGHPCAVEEATVRWNGHREFGLVFTKVRPSVQCQITDLCRKLAPLREVS